MVGTAALWGISGGAVAGIRINGFTAAAVIELVTGIALTAIAALQGHRLVPLIHVLRRHLPLLALAEAANVVLYYVALHLAPAAPVMAMHLTAPVMLLVMALIRGNRRLSPRAVCSVLLVCGAIALFGLSSGSYRHGYQLAAGIALSLASAACVAWFISLVSRVANDAPSGAAAGLQMLCSGLLLSPCLVGISGHVVGAIQLVVVAVALFAPACWLYWYAMRSLTPIVAGCIQLSEPFWGALAVLSLAGAVLSFAQMAAVVAVLGAVWLELARPPVVSGVP